MARNLTTLILLILLILLAVFIYSIFPSSTKERPASVPDAVSDNSAPVEKSDKDNSSFLKEKSQPESREESLVKLPGIYRVYLRSETLDGSYWSEESGKALKEIAEYLKENPDKIALIAGYSEAYASREKNMNEGELRAGLVANHLKSQELVPEKNMRIIGYEKVPNMVEAPSGFYGGRCVDIAVK